MTDVAMLARAFDILHPGGRWPYPPTSRSLHRINKALSVKLPETLIEFCRQCSACRHWLASLGEDFDSPAHILRVNARSKKVRRRVVGGGGRWEYVKPAFLVPFTHGYDDDFDCLDTSTRDTESGEYAIQYWAPPRILGTQRYPSFPAYIEAAIRQWAGASKAVASVLGTADPAH